MNLFVVFLIIGLSNFANAAGLGSHEVICNYTTKAVIVMPGKVKITPVYENGRVKLLNNGHTYAPVEIVFGDGALKAIIEADIASDMNLGMKIKTIESTPQILAQATSFYHENDIGVFSGSLTVLSSEIASLADREKISFDEATISEKVPLGTHFVAASIYCF